MGNRTTVVTGGGTVVYDTGDNNQLDSDGVWEYTYDDEGNQTKKTLGPTDVTWIHEYDHRNRLVHAQQWSEDPTLPGTAVLQMDAEYRYDVLSNRTAKIVDDDGADVNDAVETRYAYDGWNPAKLRLGPIGTENFDFWLITDDEGTPLNREIQGDGVDEHLARIQDSNAYFYLTDHLNSIRAVLDDTGIPTDEITYDAFGNATETSPGDAGWYLYTGREFDVETELQYNRARYYDTSTARWISQDPLGFDAGDSNLYRYVNNQSTMATDPSGLDRVQVSQHDQVMWYKSDYSTVLGLEPFGTTWISSFLRIVYDGGLDLPARAGIVHGGKASLSINDLDYLARGFTNGKFFGYANAQFFGIGDEDRDAILREWASGPRNSATRSRLVEKATFLAWYHSDKSKGLAWANALHANTEPPIRLTFTYYGVCTFGVTGFAQLPAGWSWDLAISPGGFAGSSEYHPGASYGIRKDGPGGARNQATYDVYGKLITKGLGAGTADIANGFWDHITKDVEPFDAAKRLDQFYGGDTYRQLYIEVRPAINPAYAPVYRVDGPGDVQLGTYQTQ